MEEAWDMYSNNDTTIVVSYLVYLLISVTLTVWVARTLHKRGAIFLVDAFQGNADLAEEKSHTRWHTNCRSLAGARSNRAMISRPRACRNCD